MNPLPTTITQEMIDMVSDETVFAPKPVDVESWPLPLWAFVAIGLIVAAFNIANWNLA